MSPSSRPASRPAPAALGAARLLALLLVFFGAILSAACSRHDAEEVASEETAEEDGGAPGGPVIDASRPPLDAADATPPPDARTEEERAALADAGRFCGDKELPDCPLQLWMKRNATTMITFGETTTLAEVFDQIAALAPPSHGVSRVTYANWVSIARDGAAASRMGKIPAARAACRGCHAQYLRAYHADLRALALPPLPEGHHP